MPLFFIYRYSMEVDEEKIYTYNIFRLEFAYGFVG
jgi:hypothetical protein